MATYVLITAQAQQAPESARLKKMYPDSRALNASAWIIHSTQTSKEIGDAIFPQATPPVYVVLKVSSFWGWQEPDFWEWLVSGKGEPEAGG
jgi:hypothetical protein